MKMLWKCASTMLLMVSTIVCIPAQAPLEIAFSELTMGTTFPEELLASRTAVFIKSTSQDSADHPLNWKNLGKALHEVLVANRIDAVAYYRWNDLLAGVDATRSYLETLKAREISQVIILEANEGRYDLTIVPTEDGPGLLRSGAASWHATNSTLEGVAEALTAGIRASGLEVSNFLINPTPEFFVSTRIFTKNRFETFQPDLKLDKLAVPLMVDENPENLQHPSNKELSAIMQQYPFTYELVDYRKGEDVLRKGGFQYVLLYLHTGESAVRTLLDYEPSSDSSRPVYKYYIRHLISGDIYLGTSWDGASTWQAALNHHISNLRKSLKVD